MADPLTLGAAATFGAPVLGWMLRTLHRIDKRTKRNDEKTEHHRRTLYGDARDEEDRGLVGQVAHNSTRLGTRSPPVSTTNEGANT